MGRNTKIVTAFDNMWVIQFNALPLIVTITADLNANLGLILQLEADLVASLDPLRAEIIQKEQDEASGM